MSKPFLHMCEQALYLIYKEIRARPLIPLLGKQRQEDLCESSLVYIASARPVRAIQ